MAHVDLKPRSGKPSLALLPVAGLNVAAAAMEHGALKYWPNNWRGCPPDEAATYRHAMLRHCIAFCNDNERDDPESGVPHVGHIIACASILAHILGLGYVQPSFATEFPERRQRLISDAALFGPQPEHPKDVKANAAVYVQTNASSALVVERTAEPTCDAPEEGRLCCSGNQSIDGACCT